MHNVVSSDVILEILVRLSVKSLSRFKCVSKLWFSLISDPGFVRRHVELATIDKDVEHERRRLVFIVDRDLEHEKGEPLLQFPGSKTLYHVECDRVQASNDVTAVKLDCPILIKNSLYKVKFIGSCNGLLCFCLGPDSIFLLNPATKELRRLPNLNINVESSLYDLIFRESIYGFGYDPSLDDYHVIKISYESIVHVYSLKADTWRRGAQSFSYNRFNSDPGVALNGAVHWMFGLGKNWLESVVWLLKPKSIIAFDFGKGTFRELPRPSEAALYATSLGVLGGCLCLLNHSPHETMMQQDFWIMKEYGVKESWAKVVIGVSFMDLRPLSYLKNDEVVLEMDGRLVVYHPREHTHKEVVVRGIHGRGKMGMETYVESLVSPIVGNSDLESVENL